MIEILYPLTIHRPAVVKIVVGRLSAIYNFIDVSVSKSPVQSNLLRLLYTTINVGLGL